MGWDGIGGLIVGGRYQYCSVCKLFRILRRITSPDIQALQLSVVLVAWTKDQ